MMGAAVPSQHVMIYWYNFKCGSNEWNLFLKVREFDIFRVKYCKPVQDEKEACADYEQYVKS